MANYPEWVLKFKKKGTYINFVKGKYYLYAAHSERVPGTKKVKRICDGYLGRITEKDGLIPPKDKVQSTVLVYEYGLHMLVLEVCNNIYKGFRRTFTKNGDFVMIAAILTYIYGKYDNSLFKFSYLSVCFPNLNFNASPTNAQLHGIDRGFKMIKDTISRTFGNDLDDIIICFGHLYKIKINNKLYLSEETEQVKFFKKKYNIKLEG